ncbi:4Fe-4S dicluster domain-containing protein [Pseudodesulfovibrio sp.]|uniref:4Fe-4S dicluster domain-containing protein n=1 Tax=unclassified Pseudodesulfovibrio TaxID=2661612 RepID=UPI003B009CF8
MTEYMILFDPDKCTQCHGCETACKQWRDLSYGLRFRRVLNCWRGSYPEVKSGTLSLACLHCAEPACLEACPVEAISKSAEDGRVLVDESICIGCGACARACVYGVPQIGEDKIMRKCDLCLDQKDAGLAPPCVLTCSGEALKLTEVTLETKRATEAATLRLLRQAPREATTKARKSGPQVYK